ncbi:MAG: hypothetical protein WC592_08775 [Candidatus Omnitrophota bacterium]
MKLFLKILTELFIIALLVSGFYLDKINDFSWLFSLIDPRYVRANQGINILISEKAALFPEDEGFTELTENIRMYIEPKEAAQNVVFEKLQRTDGECDYSEQGIWSL